VLTAVGLTGPVVAAELALDVLFDAPRRDRSFRTPSRFPGSAIDLAFVVDDAVPAGAIAATLRTVIGDLLEDVRAFDVFRSDVLGERRRSLAFALRLRAPDRTLTDTEVGELRQHAIDAVAAAHGAELRGASTP
jgi:phenylalanyl-tRNA synthetase beta chain